MKDTLAVSVTVVSVDGQPIVTGAKLPLVPHATFAKAPVPDLLWVPGGEIGPLKRTMGDATYLGYIRSWAKVATYVCSVCEGALLLASAGLLDGYRATTHWAFIPCLAAYPRIRVVPGFPRFVVNRRIDAKRRKRFVVTGGGISSGLDEGLELIRLIAGKKVAESVQSTTQYFPKPPVNGKLTPATSCPLDDPDPTLRA